MGEEKGNAGAVVNKTECVRKGTFKGNLFLK